MKTLLFISLIISLLLGSFYLMNTNSSINTEFMSYKISWNKQYDSLEIEEYRMSIFYENLAKIEAHNATPGITYTEGVNQFTDLTQEEFVATYLITINPEDIEQVVEEPHVQSEINDIDWGAKGSIVKNQGSCGSCWAFSAVGTLESWNLIYGTKSSILYSEQQLVDCSRSYGNNGCNGGMPSKALNFVRDKGITTSAAYPYVGRDQQCKIQGGDFKIKGQSGSSSCSGMEANLAKQPQSVCVDAGRWSSYKSGIFNNCGTGINHAVLLTGKVGTAYKIKNSWGTQWGEGGYIRLALGNTCGVCSITTYPLK